MLGEGRLGQPADVYAYGAMLLELWWGVPLPQLVEHGPPAACASSSATSGADMGSPDAECAGVAAGPLRGLVSALRMSDCPPALRRAVCRCLSAQPRARPTFSELQAALEDLIHHQLSDVSRLDAIFALRMQQ